MEHSVLISRVSEASRKIPIQVLDTLRRLHADGHEAYLAGGCVRDLLLNRTPDDYDVATSARPEVVQRLFRRVVPTGLQHGTVTVVLGSDPADKVEVTTYRGEGEYVDGRRPKHVEFITDLDRDLARRDFTINAMALDPTTSTLEDPFKGVGDLERNVIRAVGDATARFSEDGLRPLRAVRFASTLAFTLDPETQSAIPRAVSTFRKVAAERVRDELNKLLMRSVRPSVGVELLAQTGLLVEIIPEIPPPGPRTLRAVDAVPATLSLRWAALLEEHVSPDEATAILERLKHPRKLIEAVSMLIREQGWRYSTGASDAEIRRHLARIGWGLLDDLLILREANARSRAPGDEVELADEEDFRSRSLTQRALRPPLATQDLALSGHDIMALAGGAPGAYVGLTLRALLNHVLEHPEDNTRDRLEPIARQQIVINRPR